MPRLSSVIASLSLMIVAMLALSATRAEPPTGPAPAASAPAANVYDPQADARQQIAAALARAQRDHQRVLLMFGGDWCSWCRKLHGVFTTERDIARRLRNEYQLVLVDVGRFDKNVDLATRYGIDLKTSGVPFLTVLEAGGRVLVNQATGALEAGKAHDVQKVAGFLDQWKAPPQDAEELLAAALKEAAAKQKRVLLRLSAPWCIWCGRLDDFLAQPPITALVAPDYVDLKIDIERMKHGKEVAQRFCPSDKAGLPWLAVLDADGKIRATSEGPDGNIGFPVEPAEVDYFVDMLSRTARQLTTAELDQIKRALNETAARIKAQTPRRG